MLIKINGRTKFFHGIERVTKVRPGRWDVISFRGVYRVEGGRAAGGTSREWFVSGPCYDEPLRATSLMDACKLIDNT